MRLWTCWLKASLWKAGWAPLGFFLLHQFSVHVLRASRHVPWIDMPMHFFGGVAIAYFFYRSFGLPDAQPVVGALSTTARKLLSMGGVCASVVLWEFAEWVTDSLGWTGAQVGLDDTLLDMLLGMVGGAVFLLARSSRP